MDGLVMKYFVLKPKRICWNEQRSGRKGASEMKHARSDYDAIQDSTSARQLAELVLDMGMVTERGLHACDLARKVLGIDDVYHADQVLVNTNGTTRLIPRDEPVFLIRGQDAVGAETVRDWANRAERVGASPEIIRIAREHATKMDAWPKKKVPDLVRKLGS